jgi:hypothetical protein
LSLLTCNLFCSTVLNVFYHEAPPPRPNLKSLLFCHLFCDMFCHLFCDLF